MEKDSFQKGEIIIYKTSKNEVALDVRLENETVWLTQNKYHCFLERRDRQ